MESQSSEMFYVGLSIAGLCLIAIVFALRSILEVINASQRQPIEVRSRAEGKDSTLHLVQFERADRTEARDHHA